MTYKYLYQTRDNENKSGEIKAKNRAEAYAAIRKLGIKPYRVIGDDPGFLRAHWVLVSSFAAALTALALALSFFFLRRDDAFSPAPRAQLEGDMQFIAKGAADAWEGVFSTPLDRYLAAFAQPGWDIFAEYPTKEEIASFASDLDEPLERSTSERDEIRQLKNIVLGMRNEMKKYLGEGGTVEDYLEYLDERRQRECDIREKARDTLERAPESLRSRALINLNIRLRDMGIAPL